MKHALETERLRIRPHRPGDLKRLHRWQNDLALLASNASVVESQNLRRTSTQLRKWIETDDRAFLRAAVDLKETGEFIGFAQLALIDEVNRNCRIGLTIGERRLWDQGLGTELLQALIEIGFSRIHLHRITGEVYASNDRASRVFAKVGFRKEGVLRQSVYRNGTWIDEIVFGLLSDEWVLPENGSPFPTSGQQE
jgi:RimJ/RimL family protein N-acetyltransferase